MNALLAIPFMILAITFKLLALAWNLCFLPFNLVYYMFFMSPEQREELRHRREMEEIQRRYNL